MTSYDDDTTTDVRRTPIRGFSCSEAARYVGISISKFEQLVRDGRMPKPIKIDRRCVWDKYQLDLAFNLLGGDGSNEWDA